MRAEADRGPSPRRLRSATGRTPTDRRRQVVHSAHPSTPTQVTGSGKVDVLVMAALAAGVRVRRAHSVVPSRRHARVCVAATGAAGRATDADNQRRSTAIRGVVLDADHRRRQSRLLRQTRGISACPCLVQLSLGDLARAPGQLKCPVGGLRDCLRERGEAERRGCDVGLALRCCRGSDLRK